MGASFGASELAALESNKALARYEEPLKCSFDTSSTSGVAVGISMLGAGNLRGVRRYTIRHRIDWTDFARFSSTILQESRTKERRFFAKMSGATTEWLEGADVSLEDISLC